MTEEKNDCSKKTMQFTLIGIGIAAAVAVAAFFILQKKDKGQGLTPPIEAQVFPSGLKVEDLVIGDGAAAGANDRLTVHYTGWLEDGTKFDSSLDRNEPFEFILGQGQVIKGWDSGVAGMREGGKRKLIIPPDMAYGKRGAGGVIPPDAVLVFEVELLKVQ